MERVSPSVVLILVGQGGEQATAVGSGVIVKPDGILLTALHLVKGADTVQVRLKNGEIYDHVDLMIHPASGTIVGSGKVIAWDGVRAAPGISSQIIKRLRELRGSTQSSKKRG